MRRDEALKVLLEISKRCGDDIIIDSVSLTPHKKELHQFTESPEPDFRLNIQTSVDLFSEQAIREILGERGLKMYKSDCFVIIYRPENYSDQTPQIGKANI